MTQEALIGTLARLLKGLEDVGTELWAETGRGPEEVGQRYELFEGIANTREAFLAQVQAGDEAICGWLIPAIQAGDLPVAMTIRLGEDRPIARVQLAIVAIRDQANHWFCVRFESPEDAWDYGDRAQPAAASKHNYSHAQLSWEVQRSRLSVRGEAAPTWLPDSALALPLPADDALDLVLCALLAVRDPGFVARVASRCGEEVVGRFERLRRG